MQSDHQKESLKIFMIKDNLKEKNMLVLQRRKGQSILIGENIEIKILRHSEGNTHIGIKAPAEIKIFREELQTYKRAVKDEGHLTQTYPA